MPKVVEVYLQSVQSEHAGIDMERGLHRACWKRDPSEDHEKNVIVHDTREILRPVGLMARQR